MVNRLNKCIATICLLVATPQVGQSAHLLSIDSKWSSNQRSNGTEIIAEIGFSPQQATLRFEVRAYELLGENNEVVRPVEARCSEYRDTAGNYVNRSIVQRRHQVVAVRRRGLFARRRQRIVYPDLDKAQYVLHRVSVFDSQLRLAPGKHKIALEVRGLVGERVEFVEPLGIEIINVETLGEWRVFTEQYTVAHMVPERNIRSVPMSVEGELREFQGDYTITKPVYETRTRELRFGIGEEYHHARAEVQPSAPKSSFEEKQRRLVYFGTNRNRIAKEKSDSMFGTDVAGVQYGYCLVNIPLTSYQGGAATTTRYNWWARQNPDTYFFVDALNVLTPDGFRDALSADDVLVFVHGYANTFKDSLIAAAKLQHDIRFPGSVVAFSWPSEGRAIGTIQASLTEPAVKVGYFEDARKAGLSGAALATVLDELRRGQNRRGAGKIHVVAHSMGNRVLLDAMHRIAASSDTSIRPFGHVVLAAADVGGVDFARDIEGVKRLARRITFYHSGVDWALTVSRYINVDKPVGANQFFSAEMDTVDATNGTSFWKDNFGHSYWACSRYMYFDLHLLIMQNQPPNRRIPPLRGPQQVGVWQHWAFEPNLTLLKPWWRSDEIRISEPAPDMPAPEPPAPAPPAPPTS